MPKSSRRYPWPASRIDRDIMHELHLASQETGRPISRLVCEAVQAAMNVRLEQHISTPPPIGFTTHTPSAQPAA